MRLLAFLIIISCFFTDRATAQSNARINENLSYINQQFAKYNDYSTFFDVDFMTNEIICEDQFGYMRGYYENLEFKIEGSSVGLFCKDGSICLTAFEKDGTGKEFGYADYTMGLSDENGIIGHVYEVVERFEEIFSLLEEKNITKTATTDIVGIDQKISTLNDIYSKYNDYQCKWAYVEATNTLTRSSKYCTIHIPLNQGVSLEYYERDGTGSIYGYKLQAPTKVIREQCNNFDNYTDSSLDYVNNKEKAKIVVSLLQSILSGSTPIRTKPYEEDIAYVNEQFASYNQYSTSFRVDENEGMIIMTNEFGSNFMTFDDIEFRVDYKNNWIGMYCKKEDCIKQVTNKGSISYYDSYTMSLNESDGTMIRHIEEVKMKFDAILEKVRR